MEKLEEGAWGVSGVGRGNDGVVVGGWLKDQLVVPLIVG